jgi:hypothetical protein
VPGAKHQIADSRAVALAPFNPEGHALDRAFRGFSSADPYTWSVTGAEIAAAAGVVKAVGKMVDREKMDDERNQLLELAKDSPATAAAADFYARRLAVGQQVRLKLIQPFARLLGVGREYFELGQFEADLNQHLKDVPDENLQTPPGHVLGPAMQGLVFTLDEPDLKEMYLKLLTAASDDRRPDDAHPSFAQIIRELSSEEAGLLKWGLSRLQLAIARVKLVTHPNQDFEVLQNHILQWSDIGQRTFAELAGRSAFVDNWNRLGLISVTYIERLSHRDPSSDPYGWVEQMPDYPTFEKQLDENGQPQQFPLVAFDPGIVRPTDFGRRFLRAVS